MSDTLAHRNQCAHSCAHALTTMAMSISEMMIIVFKCNDLQNACDVDDVLHPLLRIQIYPRVHVARIEQTIDSLKEQLSIVHQSNEKK